MVNSNIFYNSLVIFIRFNLVIIYTYLFVIIFRQNTTNILLTVFVVIFFLFSFHHLIILFNYNSTLRLIFDRVSCK